MEVCGRIGRAGGRVRRDQTGARGRSGRTLAGGVEEGEGSAGLGAAEESFYVVGAEGEGACAVALCVLVSVGARVSERSSGGGEEGRGLVELEVGGCAVEGEGGVGGVSEDGGGVVADGGGVVGGGEGGVALGAQGRG